MGAVLTKCLGPQEPPVVFTICPFDGKGHDFGEKAAEPICSKCKQSKETVNAHMQACQQGDHAWAQDYEPLQQPPQPMQAGVAQGTPMMAIHKCTRCGLRRQADAQGQYAYDDHYMYGGKHPRRRVCPAPSYESEMPRLNSPTPTLPDCHCLVGPQAGT